MNNKKLNEKIIEAIRKTDSIQNDIRCDGIILLGDLGCYNEKVLSALNNTICDTDWDVRAETLDSLKRLNPCVELSQDSLFLIKILLSLIDNHWIVRDAAKEFIIQLADKGIRFHDILNQMLLSSSFKEELSAFVSIIKLHSIDLTYLDLLDKDKLEEIISKDLINFPESIVHIFNNSVLDIVEVLYENNINLLLDLIQSLSQSSLPHIKLSSLKIITELLYLDDNYSYLLNQNDNDK